MTETEKIKELCGDLAWEHIEDDSVLWRVVTWRPFASSERRVRSTSWFSDESKMWENVKRQLDKGGEIISIKKYAVTEVKTCQPPSKGAE